MAAMTSGESVRRVLVRSGKAPHQVYGPEMSVGFPGSGTFHSNTGNALFTTSVFRAVNTRNAEVASDGLAVERNHRSADALAGEINEKFDSYVMPMANSFRSAFLPALDRMSEVIERLRIPATVVGVGAQLPLDGDFSGESEELRAGTKRFVRAVLERSASVGVRGEFTRDFLVDLGFPADRIDIIGCPSLFDAGPAAQVTKRAASLETDAPVAINLDYNVPGADRIFTDNFDRFERLTLVSQVTPEAQLLLWGRPITDYPATLPRDTSHPLYRAGAMRFFPDPTRWVEFMAEQAFAAGTRLHGCFSALMAGTPAMLLAHDSRTLELSRYHGTPHLLLQDATAPLDLADLYEQTDLTTFNALRRENFERYTSFLDRNGIAHIFTPGLENPEYSELLRTLPFPEGIRPLDTNDVDQIASRLRWLWVSADWDRERSIETGAGHDAFGIAPEWSTTSRLVRFRGQIWGARDSLRDELRGEFAADKRELEQKIVALERLTAEYGERLAYMSQPIEKRLAAGLRTRFGRLFGRK